MEISFSDVNLKARKYKRQILKKVAEVTNKGVFLNGDENKKLAKNLRKYFPKKFITLTGSGHDALLIALRALDLTSDDEIIFPVNSYPTAFPVFLSGAKPVPIDVDENGLIDISELKKKVNRKTKAIIVVHLYGQVVNLNEVRAVSKNIFIIEDCAQAFGSFHNEQHVGMKSDIACLSFYPTKTLGTLGDGGALITSQKRFHNFFKKAVSYGEKSKYNSHFVSGHSRLPEIQAGVLNIYLKDIDTYLTARKKIHSFYRKLLTKHNLSNFIRPLYSNSDSIPTPHVFVVEAKYKNQLEKYLKKKNIPVLIHFPYPVHLLKAFKRKDFKKSSFPMAERLSKNILSLPFHSLMKKQEVEKVVLEIKKFYAKTKKS